MNIMIYSVHIMNEKKEDNVTLSILEAIENKNDMTQRHLADNLGVALGLANSYLKRCVKKVRNGKPFPFENVRNYNATSKVFPQID